jgi:hypothetical protein
MAGQGKDAAFSLDDEAFSSDHFRMFEFKVKRCPQARPHDWTRCPFAHPGEKAKRRDPRKFQYSGTACPEFRKSGCCRRGDACPFAHGVFECWCHPSRYRTQICTDGTNCKRRVCFFAHLESEVRKRDDSNVPHSAQAEMAAEAQIQQQEVAQAFQVLMNANAQNPGSLASLNLMNSLGMMGQGGHMPMNPLAERAQQLQQQLQQLQALQALQMPQQPMSAPQMAELQQGGYDNMALQGQLLGNGGQSPAQQMQQAQLDRELLLNAQQQQQHQQQPQQQHQQQPQQQQSASMMASPFARAPLGAGFDAGGRLGTPPLDSLGHAISLPNPDALRQAGVSPGLQPQHGGRNSGAMGDFNLGGGAHSRIAALRMQRHASLEGGLPAHLGQFSGGLSALGPRSASGSLGMLPPGPNPSAFARTGSQPIGPPSSRYPLQGQQLPTSLSGGGDMNISRFGSLSGPHPFAAQQPQHGHHRSFDLGAGGALSGDIGNQGLGLVSQPLGMGSQPLQSLHEELGVDMSGMQGLTLDDRAGSGWLQQPQQPQQLGSLSQASSLQQALSAQGSLAQALSPQPSLQSQLGPQHTVPMGSAKPPLVGGGPKHAGSRMGVGSPPGAAAAAFAAAVANEAAAAAPASVASSDGQLSRLSASPGPHSAQSSPPPMGLPMGPSSAALAAARSEAQAHPNVYESLGRPPAIREDQALEGVHGMLPRTAPGSDGLRVPSYIGRNASFDRILAELPRSLSEVAMQAGNPQQHGHTESPGTDGPVNFSADSLDS